MTALQEAEAFLWKHPTATMPDDNPVELLRSVIGESGDEIQELEQKIEDLEEVAEEVDALRAEVKDLKELIAKSDTSRLDLLIGFVRKLREQEKICDLEMAHALALVK